MSLLCLTWRELQLQKFLPDALLQFGGVSG